MLNLNTILFWKLKVNEKFCKSATHKSFLERYSNVKVAHFDTARILILILL